MHPSRIDCFSLAILILVSTFNLAAAAQQDENPALDIILEILRSGDKEMIPSAIVMVKELQGRQVTEILVKELPKLSAMAQVQLITALADRGDRSALPAIKAALQHENTDVQVAALKAIGVLGDSSCVPVLASSARLPDRLVRQAARDSLYKLSGENVEQTILEQIDNSQPGIQAELVRAIAERRIKGASQVLRQTVAAKDSLVRRESLRAFQFVGDQNDLDFLTKILIKNPDKSLKDTIVRIGLRNSTHCVKLVLSELKSVKDVKATCALLSVIGKLSDPEGLESLFNALKSSNTEIKKEAVRALSEWTEPAPMDRLWQIANTQEDITIHVLALRGYIRMVGLRDNLKPAQKVTMLNEAMKAARHIESKKLALSELSAIGSNEALKLTQSYFDDENLRLESQIAAVKICKAIGGAESEFARTVLDEILSRDTSESIKKMAKEVLQGNQELN